MALRVLEEVAAIPREALPGRIRAEKKRAALRELESWAAGHRQAMLARDVGGLVRWALRERKADEADFLDLLCRTAGRPPEEIDQAHRSVQEACASTLRIHDLIRRCIRLAGNLGHAVEGAADLDKASADYRRWKEDYPDLFMMAHGPVRKAIRERIAKALAGSPTESNWQGLFADEEAGGD